MIILAILKGIFTVFSLLTSPISIPSLPDDVISYANTLGEYVQMGVGILTVYTDLGYIIRVFGLILAIDVGIMLYKFVMWIIRKIPLLNIH